MSREWREEDAAWRCGSNRFGMRKKTFGVCFTKQVQQPLSLILNAELIYTEIETKFSVPEQRI